MIKCVKNSLTWALKITKIDSTITIFIVKLEIWMLWRCKCSVTLMMINNYFFWFYGNVKTLDLTQRLKCVFEWFRSVYFYCKHFLITLYNFLLILIWLVSFPNCIVSLTQNFEYLDRRKRNNNQLDHWLNWYNEMLTTFHFGFAQKTTSMYCVQLRKCRKNDSVINAKQRCWMTVMQTERIYLYVVEMCQQFSSSIRCIHWVSEAFALFEHHSVCWNACTVHRIPIPSGAHSSLHSHHTNKHHSIVAKIV